jgi:hypothetical protein
MFITQRRENSLVSLQLSTFVAGLKLSFELLLRFYDLFWHRKIGS